MYHTIHPTKKSSRYAYWRPNAADQPRPRAGAQRTLSGVGCSRLLGAGRGRPSGSGPPRPPARTSRPGPDPGLDPAPAALGDAHAAAARADSRPQTGPARPARPLAAPPPPARRPPQGTRGQGGRAPAEGLHPGHRRQPAAWALRHGLPPAPTVTRTTRGTSDPCTTPGRKPPVRPRRSARQRTWRAARQAPRPRGGRRVPPRPRPGLASTACPPATAGGEQCRGVGVPRPRTAHPDGGTCRRATARPVRPCGLYTRHDAGLAPGRPQRYAEASACRPWHDPLRRPGGATAPRASRQVPPQRA